MIPRPGVAGTLFPEWYLRDALERDTSGWQDPVQCERRHRQLRLWWTGVVATCGPASGLRSLFDLVAMPLFGMLGFRASGARFEPKQARAVLETRDGTPVGLVLLPWATRPSVLWRDLASTARDLGASWCFLVAPPFLSLVDARGHAMRRSIEFTLPDVLTPGSFGAFWALSSSSVFERSDHPGPRAVSRIDMLVDRAMRSHGRVREDLRHGVVEALRSFMHVLDGATLTDRFDEALTIVYRILFLRFAESRALVPCRNPIYASAYAVDTLCREALGNQHPPGLWEGLAAITRLSREGCRTDDLAVRPFNGHLFARTAAPSLEARSSRRPGQRAVRRDRAMRDALIALGSRQGCAGRESLSYRDLGVEELGAVYERVLDLDPQTIDAAAAHRLVETRLDATRSAHSARRKQSGTFYTPRPLAEFVVRRTLAPLVDGRPSDGILALRVLDPAMGSGAFLVAACRYLARAYERALIDEGRASPADLDVNERANIRRLIAERCLAGVDRNPVAVQLARLSLWLTTLAQGKPLNFLDHRLRVGNSLVGASADDLVRVADRRRIASPHSLPLFDVTGIEPVMRRVVGPIGDLCRRRDDSAGDVRAKQRLWSHLSAETSPLHPWRLAATLWCAQWFWPPAEDGTPGAAEVRALIDAVLKNDRTLPDQRVSRRLVEAGGAAARHGFFHWSLEFSDVFYDNTGASSQNPGFDAVLGNPPWEMLRQESAERTRQESIDDIAKDGQPLVRFIRQSGLYRSCDRGHVNLYQPFLERALTLCRRGGQVGLILPWGVAADDGAAALRRRLLEECHVHTVVGLDNARGLFPIHRGLRFVVLTASPGGTTGEIRARFGVKDAEDIDGLPDRDPPDRSTAYPVRLTVPQLERISGPAMRVPDIRRFEDLGFLDRLATTYPALGDAAGWSARFGRELNATEDRGAFGPVGLPVIEGKHIEPFRADVDRPSYRIGRADALRLLPDARFDRPRVGYRDVSGVGNTRSLIAAIVPAGVVTTHTIFCLRSPVSAEAGHFLCGVFNSYVLNAVVRLLMGGHVTTSLIERLPVPLFGRGTLERRIARLSRRISMGPPSIALSARLQAEVARLYEIDVVEFRRLLDGFPLVPIDERERAVRALAEIKKTSGVVLRES